MTIPKYETKPLECWPKAKEMIADYYRDVGAAREEGKLLVAGGSSSVLPLPAGLGDYVFFGAEPYAAVISTDPQFSLKCTEEVEARGYARDLCSYLRNYWGSMFLDRYFFGGPFPKPDFCFTTHICDTHAKWFQVVSEYLDVPYACVDIPLIPARYGRYEQKVEFLLSQLWDTVEWMEKITGRHYDDELLIEAVSNECNSLALQGEICLLQKAVPAPLSQKTMFSLYIIPHLLGHHRDAVEFCREVKEEVNERVAQGIAGLATERCRLMDDAQPPWYFLKLYRYFEEYGAAVIGSYYSFYLGGNLVEDPDGTLVAPRTIKERGMPMKTREDALRAMVEFYLEKPILPCFLSVEEKNEQMIGLAKQWNVDGMIIHLNRGCEGQALGQMENRIFIQSEGLPVMTYEGNMGDKRELDETEVLDRVDAFMESLDLTRIVAS